MGLFDMIYVVGYLWVKAESKQSLTLATCNKSILEKTQMLMVDKEK